MKVLIFNENVKFLNFLNKKFRNSGVEIITAENRSKFIAFYLNIVQENISVIILPYSEFDYYNMSTKYLLKESSKLQFIISYKVVKGKYLKKIKIYSQDYLTLEAQGLKKKIKKILIGCKQQPNKEAKIKENLKKDFVSKLPKKSALLLQQLLLNSSKGLSAEEITALFWGDKNLQKQHCVYNHIYNLRRSLATYSNFIIYKEKNRYKLIDLKQKV